MDEQEAGRRTRWAVAVGLAAFGAVTAAGLSAALVMSSANAAPLATQPSPAPPPFKTPDVVQRSAQSTPATVGEARQLGDTFANVAERASRSVVTISVEVRRAQQQQHPFGFFFGQPGAGDSGEFARGGGSGIVMRADGVILTNNHVVKDAVRIDVVLRDGRKFRARVMGTDEATDLAVLKIEASGLPAIAFANSSRARVGEWVLAIGSPFGLDYTLTAGVLSATGRGGIGANEIEDYLQTDASINPGNSGGPLINLNGEVLGINTMIIGRNSGIGFAIPSNLARSVADQLAEGGVVRRAWIGVAFQELTPELASSLGSGATRGALVSSVSSNGPASKAGVQPGDVVTSVNDQPVGEGRDLLRAVLSHRVGATLRLGILRDGQRSTLSLTTAERPGEGSHATRNRPERRAAPAGGFGLALEPLTPDAARRLGYRGDGKVVVADVTQGSAADRAELRRGDVIVTADRSPVRDPRDVVNALSDGRALLRVERGQAAYFVVLSKE